MLWWSPMEGPRPLSSVPSIATQVRQRAQQVTPIFAKAKKAEENAEPEAVAKLMFKKGSTHKASLQHVLALTRQQTPPTLTQHDIAAPCLGLSVTQVQ